MNLEFIYGQLKISDMLNHLSDFVTNLPLSGSISGAGNRCNSV